MSAFDVLFRYDAAIFFVLGLLAAVPLILLDRSGRGRERIVDLLLATFLFFSGTVRFLLLFLQALFFPDLDPSASILDGQDEVLARLAFAELAIAIVALFGLRATVPVRLVAIVPLIVVLLGTGVGWAVLALVETTAVGWPQVDTVVAVVAGLFAAVMMALDWANRSDAPDPLEPGGKRFTY